MRRQQRVDGLLAAPATRQRRVGHAAAVAARTARVRRRAKTARARAETARAAVPPTTCMYETHMDESHDQPVVLHNAINICILAHDRVAYIGTDGSEI